MQQVPKQLIILAQTERNRGIYGFPQVKKFIVTVSKPKFNVSFSKIKSVRKTFAKIFAKIVFLMKICLFYNRR